MRARRVGGCWGWFRGKRVLRMGWPRGVGKVGTQRRQEDMGWVRLTLEGGWRALSQGHTPGQVQLRWEPRYD